MASGQGQMDAAGRRSTFIAVPESSSGVRPASQPDFSPPTPGHGGVQASFQVLYSAIIFQQRGLRHYGKTYIHARWRRAISKSAARRSPGQPAKPSSTCFGEWHGAARFPGEPALRREA